MALNTIGQFYLTTPRLLSAGDIPTGQGGVLFGDSVPNLELFDGKILRIRWPAGDQTPIALQAISPFALNELVAVMVSAWAISEDAAPLTVGFYQGIDGINLGSDTPAYSSVLSLQSINVSGLVAAVEPWNIRLTPGAHPNFPFFLYGLYVTWEGVYGVTGNSPGSGTSGYTTNLAT